MIPGGMLLIILTFPGACRDKDHVESRAEGDTQQARITYVNPQTVKLTMADGQTAIFYGTESVRLVEFRTEPIHRTRLDSLVGILRTGMLSDSFAPRTNRLEE